MALSSSNTFLEPTDPKMLPRPHPLRPRNPITHSLITSWLTVIIRSAVPEVSYAKMSDNVLVAKNVAILNQTVLTVPMSAIVRVGIITKFTNLPKSVMDIPIVMTLVTNWAVKTDVV